MTKTLPTSVSITLVGRETPGGVFFHSMQAGFADSALLKDLGWMMQAGFADSALSNISVEGDSTRI